MNAQEILSTQFCRRVGLQYPICQAGMGFVAPGRLAAAVSAAGGLGVIGAGTMTAAQLREEIHVVRDTTDKPFGVDILFAQIKADRTEQVMRYTDEVNRLIAVVLEERVPVLIAGLGSPAGVYLAASGIGTIGIIDSDTVDESNLQRQILHWTSSVGMPKVDSARRTLFEVNPDVKVRTYNLRMDASNVVDIFKDYDLIISGSDNFQTAYLVNDAAVMLGKPVCYGSIFRFDGQISTFVPYQGPCFRCIFAHPAPPDLAPSCDEAGVMGILPGVVGLIQATEAVKVLLNIGDPLIGRYLAYDALAMTFRTLKVRRDPNCATCGPNAHIDLNAIQADGCSGPTS